MLWFKKWRRRRLSRQPFPPEWLSILQKHVPYYKVLPGELQAKLRTRIQIFIAEKNFEGCAGQQIHDTIRVCVAAQACILTLGLDDFAAFYPDLRSILIYPKKYVARLNEQHDDFFVEEGFEPRHGEAWSHGTIVLSWDEVKKGSRDIGDGENLIFHEFAHQLDYEHNATTQDTHYLSWAQILSSEYRQFLHMLRQNQYTLLDEYGAENIAEFFAVATEYFFEKPEELNSLHPTLYRQLKDFYNQDPLQYSL